MTAKFGGEENASLKKSHGDINENGSEVEEKENEEEEEEILEEENKNKEKNKKDDYHKKDYNAQEIISEKLDNNNSLNKEK